MTADQIRAKLTNQICPLCGAGPFRVVAAHAWQAHGLHARALRDLAGLPYKDSICSPEHHTLMATMMRDNQRALAMAGHHHAGRAPALSKEGKRRLTEAGRRSGALRKIPVTEHGTIRRRLEAGESKRAIARDYGVTPQLIRLIELRKAG